MILILRILCHVIPAMQARNLNQLRFLFLRKMHDSIYSWLVFILKFMTVYIVDFCLSWNSWQCSWLLLLRLSCIKVLWKVNIHGWWFSPKWRFSIYGCGSHTLGCNMALTCNVSNFDAKRLALSEVLLVHFLVLGYEPKF